MIVIKLQGGLGNQMFQYALGRHLSLLNNTPLILDTSLMVNDPNNRKLELNQFNTYYKINNPFLYKLKQLFTPLNEVNEKLKFIYDEEILNLRGNYVLTGSWQSEKYFIKIQETIRQDFTIKKKMGDEFINLSTTLKKINSIAIHVRHSDYITNPSANSFHGICSPNYYQNAINYIIEHVSDPNFFISSDDPQWSRENIKIDGYPIHYFDYNDPMRDAEYISLMSCCRHHIIANSTFSWWWAWLCDNPQKLVIAPDPWLDSKKYMTTDLLPDGWIKIQK